MATGGTKLHDQIDTNLCAYFATMSALRHQLRKSVGNEKSRIHKIARLRPQDFEEAKKYAGLEIHEYLNQKDKNEKRFERDLAVMIGCVCPRALSVRSKI